MVVRIAGAAFALLLAAPACAVETYTIDPGHTIPAFEVIYGGFSIQRGNFSKARGKVTLDRAAASGAIDVTIDPATVSTSQPARDELLKSEAFFDVARFPAIVFKANRMRFDGERLIGADGELTMLGVTRPVMLSVTGFKCGSSQLNKAVVVCGAEVAATIRRSDWGMKTGIPDVADEVRITIPVEAVRE